MEDAIEMELCKIFEIVYDDGKGALAYIDDSSKFYFTDFRGTTYSKDICWDDVKGSNELHIAEGRVRTGDPVEIIHNDGITLSYYIENLGSALAFNLPDAKGYKNRQAKNSDYITKISKLVRVPVEIRL